MSYWLLSKILLIQKHDTLTLWRRYRCVDNTHLKKGYGFLFWQQVSEIMAPFQISSTNISLALLGIEATDMQSTIAQIFEEITLNRHTNIVSRQRNEQMQGP